MRRTDPKTIARLLTACRAGEPVARAAARLGISESTATRALRALRARAEGAHLDVPLGRPSMARLRRRLPARPPQPVPEDDAVDEICKDLRHSGFPYPEQLDAENTALEVNRLRSVELRLINDEIHPRSPAGIRLCVPHFPNRYAAVSSASSRNNLSALDAWRDGRALRKAVLFQLRHGDPVTPHRVLRAVTLLQRTPTIFRPAVARYVYETFCPRGGVAWDPCAGYGGRLLGAHVAGVNYVGTDVDEETVRGNLELAATVGASATVNCVPAETFDPPPVDLVFTSPPYFDRERYSVGERQSWRRYATLDAWVEGFLRPVVARAHRALQPGGRLALNIADLRDVALVEKASTAALSQGFALEATLRIPLAAINRSRPTEPLLVFRKA